MSTPVLRHETGESLGGIGHFRVIGFFETTRLFAFIPPGAVYSANQDNSVFQGSLVGGRAEAGLLPKLDLMAGATFSSSGGGWQLGAKYMFFSKNGLSAAAMAAYSATSSNGSVVYQAVSGLTEVPETLSANTVDLSVPVSYRLSPEFAAYSGLMLLKSSVVGVVGGNAVSTVAWDTGLNLGLRLTFGKIDTDVEGAFLRVYDPFGDTTRIIPYFGIGAGIVF